MACRRKRGRLHSANHRPPSAKNLSPRQNFPPTTAVVNERASLSFLFIFIHTPISQCRHLASSTHTRCVDWRSLVTKDGPRLTHSKGNARTTVLLAVAKANNLELDIVETVPYDGVSDDYRRVNRLGKIPSFEGADNFILTECIAIAIYRESSLAFLSLLPKDEIYHYHSVIPV